MSRLAITPAWWPVIATVVVGVIAAALAGAGAKDFAIALAVLVVAALPALVVALPLPGVIHTAMATGGAIWRIAVGGLVVLTMAPAYPSVAVAMIAGLIAGLTVDLTVRIRALTRESQRA